MNFGRVVRWIAASLGVALLGALPIVENAHAVSGLVSNRTISSRIIAPGTVAWTFNASGTFTPPRGVYSVRAIISAGGASGGCSASSATMDGAGGGAAGGYRDLSGLAVTPGTGVTVTVGAKGTACAAGAHNGNPGSDSSFGSSTATGGGYGGGSAINAAGGPGGSGGGGASDTGAAGAGNTPSTSPAQGSNGAAAGGNPAFRSGGGGGQSGTGVAGSSTGAGGPGITHPITGVAVNCGGGGGQYVGGSGSAGPAGCTGAGVGGKGVAGTACSSSPGSGGGGGGSDVAGAAGGAGCDGQIVVVATISPYTELEIRIKQTVADMLDSIVGRAFAAEVQRYFARIGDDGAIQQIVAADDTWVAAQPGRWVETTRYQNTGRGHVWTGSEFVPPQPFPSWVRQGGDWGPPSQPPTDGKRYRWNENTRKWLENAR